MLKELTKYNSFGRIDDYILLFDEVFSSEPIKVINIKKYCLNKNNYYRTPVDAILALLSDMKIIDMQGEEIFLNPLGLSLQEDLVSKESIEDFIRLLLVNYFDELIGIVNFTFDYKEETYFIRNSDIPFHFSGIRNLLINIGFLTYINNNVLILEKKFITLVEEHFKKKKRQLSLEKLKEIQAKKEEMGEIAENFVLNYEKKRLGDCGFLDLNKVKKISDVDVTAGYDIVSYINNKSNHYDKFIEVKSFELHPYFYWSKNEIEVAKEKKDNYFLYLVDRKKITSRDYKPIIISNPYETVYKNSENWIKEVQSWRFDLYDNF
ncbi:DUF3883 domain-containing protein [Aquibacillus saliphilus]|uniref:DUF3883 domain-containing protein n=1 Tax=Aquibacillus saliphilus TaxID=1909422 RepID=UPI001CEFC8B1|nr:DUF3883 domain-containing protein [Aquibacillus saliphilus]